MKKQEKGRNHINLPLAGHFPQAQRKCSQAVWFRISLYPGRGKETECLFIPPSHPLLISSVSYLPWQPQHSIDQTATGRARQPRSMGWVSGRAGRVAGEEILASWATTAKPHPSLGQHWDGPALLELQCPNQGRAFLSASHFQVCHSYSKTSQAFLLPKASYLNSLALFSKSSIIWPQVIYSTLFPTIPQSTVWINQASLPTSLCISQGLSHFDAFSYPKVVNSNTFRS